VARTLADWLDYQQSIHPRSIELGLERVRAVWLRLGAPRPAPLVITVGGTNGKGSTVAFLEAILAAAGYRIGTYTSPHLLRYNERIRVLGADASDATLIDAFERIEAARKAAAKPDIPLTYFEFGTLAALWIFAQSGLDVAILEVGLGGRLDAVNIIDADVAVVTTVDLDHQDWLGNDINSIAREKAGIFRRGRPAIIGMREPPPDLLAEADRIGALTLRAGRDFHVTRQGNGWQWQCAERTHMLPQPLLAAPRQIENAACAVAALHVLQGRIDCSPAAVVAGVRNARVAARLQRWHKDNAPELVVDVAHNPQAARALAEWLEQQPSRGAVLAVFGALTDKDVDGIVAPLLPHVARWFIGDLSADTPRGFTASQLRERMPAATALVEQGNIDAALDAACSAAAPEDRILAFGSFFVAAATLNWVQRHGYHEAMDESDGYN
jgi:dihydrofolate synthase/folylpolyglutamate synthase